MASVTIMAVCRLPLCCRGRLGSCSVPLKLQEWCVEKLLFSMDPAQASIVVDSRAMEGMDEVAGPLLSQGMVATTAAAAGGAGAEAQQGIAEGEGYGAAIGAAVAAHGLQATGGGGGGGGMQQIEDGDEGMGYAGVMEDEEEEVVEVMELSASFADQLELLVSAEEVMADFALFDGAGRLLMGR